MKQKIDEKIREQANRLALKKVTMPQTRAFSVHLFTASGSFFAFLSLVAAADGHWPSAFAWLGLALLVDGLDGPIARKLQVKYVLPTWSGELLDNIIDYVTYVLIPAFAIYKNGFVDPWLAFFSSAIIVVSSAIYYADTGMKTKENFFKGFPAVWNMVVLSLFVISPNQWVTFSVILVSAIVSFLPVYFLHPVRVARLRWLNLPVFLAWCAFGIIALFYSFNAPSWVQAGIAVTGIYLYIIGAVMQFFPNLGNKATSK